MNKVIPDRAGLRQADLALPHEIQNAMGIAWVHRRTCRAQHRAATGRVVLESLVRWPASR